jgi:N-acetylated-alpha-linked acidic dipeptidase
VEDDSLRLLRGAVAYLNQDVSASGPAFGGGGSPSLRGVLRDVARTVPDPAGAGSVYDAWRRRANVAVGDEPAMGDPGGGSDFAGFYNHLGIPIADWGFGGSGGVYHSQYDSHEFVRRFADPGFRYHAAAARVGTAMLLRLANADVVPFDYAEYARTLRGRVAGLERLVEAARAGDAAGPAAWRDVRPAALAAALDTMERAARDLASTRDAALAAAAPPTAARLDAANAALRRVERAITRPTGLVGRPWFRNLVYAADVDNGYATILFPGVAEAIRAGDAPRARREIDDLAARLRAATGELAAARAALR